MAFLFSFSLGCDMVSYLFFSSCSYTIEISISIEEFKPNSSIDLKSTRGQKNCYIYFHSNSSIYTYTTEDERKVKKKDMCLYTAIHHTPCKHTYFELYIFCRDILAELNRINDPRERELETMLDSGTQEQTDQDMGTNTNAGTCTDADTKAMRTNANVDAETMSSLPFNPPDCEPMIGGNVVRWTCLGVRCFKCSSGTTSISVPSRRVMKYNQHTAR